MAKDNKGFKHKVFDEAIKEFDTDLFIIADYEYTINGTIVTHIGVNKDGYAYAVSASDTTEPDFWEGDFEQLYPTKEQWKDIVEIVKDLLD